MTGIHDLWLFVLSGLLLNMTPGADTLYIVGRATRQGRRAGAVAALGIGAGCIVHTLAAALGLSAILATSATAFAVVKWMGAAYLVYLGATMLRSRPRAARARRSGSDVASARVRAGVSHQRPQSQGRALLPRVPSAVHRRGCSRTRPSRSLLLGVIFNVNGTLWNLLVAGSAAGLGRRLVAGGRAATWLNRTLGGLFVCLGVRLALTER